MVVEDLLSGPRVCGRVSGPVLVTFPLMRRGSAAAGGSLVNSLAIRPNPRKDSVPHSSESFSRAGSVGVDFTANVQAPSPQVTSISSNWGGKKKKRWPTSPTKTGRADGGWQCTSRSCKFTSKPAALSASRSEATNRPAMGSFTWELAPHRDV